MSEKTLTTVQVKKLHKLENLALMLDKSCQAGEIDDDDIEKAQAILNKISKELIADKDIIGPRLYIVYENQAMLHWIDGNKDEARDFAKIAIDVKGGGDLFTETANDFIDDVQDKTKTKSIKPDAKLVGLHGWLAWFVVSLIITIFYSFYSSIIGFTHTGTYTPEVTVAYPSFPSLINFENMVILLIAIFGLFLLVMIIKLKRKAIKFAVGYSIAIIAFEFIDTFLIYSIFTGNQAALDGAFKDGMIVRTITLNFIWIVYFIFSKRVKLTLTKE